MTTPILGHAAYHPHANRPIWPGDTAGTGPGIHHIACTTEEYRWVCQQLARRRAKLATPTRRAGKGVRGDKGK